MTEEQTPESFQWMLNNFVAGTNGVAHALAVSADGIKLAASDGLTGAISGTYSTTNVDDDGLDASAVVFYV